MAIAFVTTIGDVIGYSPGATWTVQVRVGAMGPRAATAAAIVFLGDSGVPPELASLPSVAT